MNMTSHYHHHQHHHHHRPPHHHQHHHHHPKNNLHDMQKRNIHTASNEVLAKVQWSTWATRNWQVTEDRWQKTWLTCHWKNCLSTCWCCFIKLFLCSQQRVNRVLKCLWEKGGSKRGHFFRGPQAMLAIALPWCPAQENKIMLMHANGLNIENNVANDLNMDRWHMMTARLWVARQNLASSSS